MRKPRLLDLYARAQGTSVGYARAGFAVTASDIGTYAKHPEIETFITANALDVLDDVAFCRTFDVITGSPPCQLHTKAWKIQQNDHPDLIPPTRKRMQRIGRPYVIENVPGAPLVDSFELCGCMFPALNVYRERWFEASDDLKFTPPHHVIHAQRTTKMGRPPKPGERMHVVGNFSGAAEARLAMGIDWMSRDNLREAVPPAYTEWIGRRMLDQLT